MDEPDWELTEALYLTRTRAAKEAAIRSKTHKDGYWSLAVATSQALPEQDARDLVAFLLWLYLDGKIEDPYE
jgi:hypothetical protein